MLAHPKFLPGHLSSEAGDPCYRYLLLIRVRLKSLLLPVRSWILLHGGLAAQDPSCALILHQETESNESFWKMMG